jgi:NTP pyrophosphatase (non-canonical NTP hydrolase)
MQASKSKHEQQLQGALRTEPSTQQYGAACIRLESPEAMRILHAAMGLCTETGELMDALKKHIFYGKTLDRVNLLEEGGDVCWYLLVLSDCLRDVTGPELCPFEEMIDRMLAKLRKRYPEKFTESNALIRDLDSERQVLEGKMPDPNNGHGAGDGFPGEDYPSDGPLPDPDHKLPERKCQPCPIVSFSCINPECDSQEAYRTPSGFVCVKCGGGQ